MSQVLVSISKLSRDPEFTRKLEDIVGLYLNPLEHAIVLRRGKEPDSGPGPHAGRAFP